MFNNQITMKNLLLTSDYINAYKIAFKKQLDCNFEIVSDLLNTTYLNDECGSFQFSINELTLKVYLPTELMNETYNLFVIDNKGNEVHLCNKPNLSLVVDYLNLFMNKYCADIIETQDGQFHFVNDWGIIEYYDEIDIDMFFIDEVNYKIYLK